MTDMHFRQITRQKFESYFYGRTPYVKSFTTELEWFICEKESVVMLATMLRCEIDKDFNGIVLGRDADRKFRCIHVIASKGSREELISCLEGCADELIGSHVGGMFPQGDESEVPFAIFNFVVSPEKRSHYIKLLTDDPKYFPARVMMEELAHWFKDPDGVFIRRWQGDEFNSRLFELYLHAVFHELDFVMDRSHPQPDYLLSKAGQVIALEAATVAEMESAETPVSITEEVLRDIDRHVAEEMPFRFARTLSRKLQHRPQPLGLPYWELPHTKGLPFVIAVHDYSVSVSPRPHVHRARRIG